MPTQDNSKSPLAQKVDLPSVDLLVDGTAISDSLSLQEIEVTLEVNKIAKAVFTVLDGSASKQEFENQDKFEPGKPVKISLGYHRSNQLVFEGIIIKTGVRIESGQSPLIVVQCADKAIKTTLSRRNMLFQKMSDSEIISKIVQASGLQADIASTSYKHKEIIQYNATDWDFILSRAELNGRLVCTVNNKIVVKEPNTGASPSITLAYGFDIISTELQVDAPSQLEKVETASWDMSNRELIKSNSQEPSVNSQGAAAIDGKKLAGKMSADTFKMHVPAPAEDGLLKTWANARLLRSRLSRIRGNIRCQGIASVVPNSTIKIDRLSTYFTGTAFVSGVRHLLRKGNWITDITIGLNPRSFIESNPDIEIPAASGMLPGINGLYLGKVLKIDQDPDGETRIQVDIPVLEQSDGIWCRYGTPYATDKAGHFFMPEINDEVILGFLNNDPSYPIILGNLYSKKSNPPYTPDDKNSTKAIVTKNQLKIIFEDEKKNLILETPGGHTIKMLDEDQKIIITDSNKNQIEMSSDGIKIDSAKDIIVTAKGKISMEATQNISMKSSGGDIQSEGLNVKAKASVTASVEGSMAELKGSGQTTVKGGIVMIN